MVLAAASRSALDRAGTETPSDLMEGAAGRTCHLSDNVDHVGLFSLGPPVDVSPKKPASKKKVISSQNTNSTLYFKILQRF